MHRACSAAGRPTSRPRWIGRAGNARRDCETLLLDGGDLFQGTPASNLSYGRPVVEYYNRMGYAAAALGNHEFDWGLDTLRARMRQAKFGFFGANVRYKDGRDVEWIRNDTIVVRGRTRIGIIGVSTVANTDDDSRQQCGHPAVRRPGAYRGQHRNGAQKARSQFHRRDRPRRSVLLQQWSHRVRGRDHRPRAKDPHAR